MTPAWDEIHTISGLLAHRAALTPSAVAFQQELSPGRWQPITWREFATQAAQVRAALHAAGLRPGDRLALIAPVSLNWELLHHAALALGAVVVGLDAHDLPQRVAGMIEQADVTALACSDLRALARCSAARLQKLHFVLGIGDAAQTANDGMTPVRWLNWDELLALPTEPAPASAAPTSDSAATVLFTSGTTGAPKGIVYSQGQVCLAALAIARAYSFVGTDGRLLCWLPLSNLFQRMVNLAAVRQGAATYLLADPRRVMQSVAAVSPDIFVGVPRFYEKLYAGLQDHVAALPWLQRAMVSWAWRAGRRYSRHVLQSRSPTARLSAVHWLAERLVLRRLRRVMGSRLQCLVTGSAPMPLRLLEEFHALGWLVLEAYGLSENVLPMAMNAREAFRLGTVGRPMPGNDVQVGPDCAIRVRGPGLFKGYLGETAARPLDAEGYYLTGDLGHLDADGYLTLTGRSGEIIKTSTGRRVAPALIEAALRQVPGIDQALVIGAGRKCLVVLCTLTDGAEPRPRIVAALTQQLQTLSPADQPRGVLLLEQAFSIEAGELTPNLKLRRAEIEKRHASQINALYSQLDDNPAHLAGLLVL